MTKEMALKIIYASLLMLVPPLISSCAPGLNRSMVDWGHMMGFGYGGEYMWLVLLVLIGVVAFILLQVSKSRGFNGSIIETPFDVLKMRYAKGEIDKEEFNRRKKDLQS